MTFTRRRVSPKVRSMKVGVPDALPVRAAAGDGGRDPDAIEITSGGGPVPDLDTVARYQDLGVTRLVVGMPTYDWTEIGPALGRLSEALISKVG